MGLRKRDSKRLYVPDSHCKFTWKPHGKDHFVRCFHAKHYTGRHEAGLHHVRVGQEENVEHLWVDK